MRLLSPLLVLFLCLTTCRAFQCSTSPYSTQIPEYIICPVANRSEETYNECDYSSILPLIACDSPDLLSPTPVCWRLRDPSTGILEVDFSLLPQYCNFTGYDVTLMVHEATDCPSSREEFKKHSQKEVAIKDCTNASCENQCSQRASLLFWHVFSACYQLYLTPRRHYQAFQGLVSAPVVIMTQYNKTPISAIQKPVLHLDWDPAVLSMQVQFPMSPASSHVTLSHGINTAVGQHACRKTGVTLATCATCLGSPEIQCNTDSSLSFSPSCSYQGESIVRCKFSGLKPGNYCVRIQFYDDRCMADTIWEDENNNYSACTWELFQQFLSAEEAVEVQDGHSSYSTFNPALLILLVLAIIVACFLTGFVVYRHMLPNYPQFLPVRQKTLQLSERPLVLLLYARDCPSFMQAVAQLRTLMRRHYNCQVMDCWEDSQYESVASSPARWLVSLLSNPKVRTVLVTSPASVLQEAALVHGTVVEYRQPRAFDCVLTHALTSLHETAGQDSYKRVFIVRLDTEGDGVFPKTRTYLNPLTNYVLPVHLNKLMATLYNVDSTGCTITLDEQTDVMPLTDAISEYRRYLRENPQYINKLMASNAVSLQDILA